MRKSTESGWQHSIYSDALPFKKHRTTSFISSHFTLWFCILNYFAGQAKLHNIQPSRLVKKQWICKFVNLEKLPLERQHLGGSLGFTHCYIPRAYKQHMAPKRHLICTGHWAECFTSVIQPYKYPMRQVLSSSFCRWATYSLVQVKNLQGVSQKGSCGARVQI